MLSERDRKQLGSYFEGITGTISGMEVRNIATDADLPMKFVEYYALEQGVVPKRYDRNMGTLGTDGQCRLLASTVVVAGLGGLGGYVVENLARLGIGRIIGADGDVFDEGNLNRQLVSSTENLGFPKAEETAGRVAKTNPAVEFVPHIARFEELGEDLFQGADLVFDCLDSIPMRRELEKRCEFAGVTLIHGAIAGWAGQVAVCRPGSGLISVLYGGAEKGAEGVLGNLPFTAAVAAGIMTAEGARVFLGEEDPERRVLFFDLQNGDWRTIHLRENC